MSRGFPAILLGLSLIGPLGPGRALADSRPPITDLRAQIGERLERVDEFRFIRSQAEAMGVRVWLFGGTAAGYAHYVEWDLQRETGDPRYQPDRFDYDYTNIYRSNQDLDIVVDGTAEQAAELQGKLAARYPHLQGSKTAWEVRTLRTSAGDKEALLDNPDFLRQHSDSNSTGMIEITHPPGGEERVRDLRDWESKDPFFLRDVSEGKLHYYFSPEHAGTARARAGNNPPILSVIRYLTKAFQYELALRDEDVARLREIIQEFQPEKESRNGYVASWIEKNAKKLIQNAVNIDYAVRMLDELGLRAKLRALGDVGKYDSLAWWMSKEPLRDRPLGTKGRTAAELFRERKLPVEPEGKLMVAHETVSFQAYESISRAHTGDPNVLISREGHVGEGAALGEGFYTRIGRQGAKGTRITLRFEVDPAAREGTDFELFGDEVLLFHNKRALRVVPESLNLDAVEYFQMLRDRRELAPDNLGALEKLKRRVQSKTELNSTQEAAILAMVREEIAESAAAKRVFASPLLDAWREMPAAAHHPELVDLMFEKLLWGEGALLAVRQADASRWNPQFGLALDFHSRLWISRDEKLHRFVEALFSRPDVLQHPEWLDQVLGSRHWAAYAGAASALTARAEATNDPAAKALLSSLIEALPPRLEEGLVGSKTYRGLLTRLFEHPPWRDHPMLFLSVAADTYDGIREVLERPEWISRTWIFEAAVKQRSTSLIDALLRMPIWWRDERLLAQALIWPNQVQVFNRDRLSALSLGFKDPEVVNHLPFLFRLMQDKNFRNLFGTWAMSLQEPHWKGHPEVIEALIREDLRAQGWMWDSIRVEFERILELPQWRDDPELRQLAGSRAPTLKSLRAGVKAGRSIEMIRASAAVVTTRTPGTPAARASASNTSGGLGAACRRVFQRLLDARE